MGEDGLIGEGMVREAPDHLGHGGPGKGVQGAVQNQERFAVGHLLVQNLGDIGAALAGDIAAGLNEDLETGIGGPALRQHGLEALAQGFHVQRLLTGGKGDAQAGTEIGEPQRHTQVLLDSADEGEHVFIIVGQHGGGQLLALGVNMDAHQLHAGEVGVPKSLLVHAELAGHAAVGGEGEVRIDADADLRGLSLFGGDLPDHIHLV